MREITKEAMREALRYRTYESLIEANFIKLFAQDFMPKQVRAVASECISESMAKKQADTILEDLIREIIPSIAFETLNEESTRKDKEELENVAFMEYIDRCIMEAIIQ